MAIGVQVLPFQRFTDAWLCDWPTAMQLTELVQDASATPPACQLSFVSRQVLPFQTMASEYSGPDG